MRDLFRRALKKAGMEYVPVIAASVQGLESNPGFRLNYSFAKRALFACEFGDLFMKCLYRVRPYELERGSADRLHEKLEKECIDFLYSENPSGKDYKRLCKRIVQEFDSLPIHEDMKKPKVGIVGEILVKYSPAANNHLVELLEREGAEAVQPELLDFILYSLYNENFKCQNHYAGKATTALCNIGIKFVEHCRKTAREALDASRRFKAPHHIQSLAERAKAVISIGNQTGEGWFLTGEMLELIEEGTKNIVCVQPFGCLPNHIMGNRRKHCRHRLRPRCIGGKPAQPD